MRETKSVYDLVNAEWDEREILFWCKNLYVIFVVCFIFMVYHPFNISVCLQPEQGTAENLI
jgi:hypothetical protein